MLEEENGSSSGQNQQNSGQGTTPTPAHIPSAAEVAGGNYETRGLKPDPQTQQKDNNNVGG